MADFGQPVQLVEGTSTRRAPARWWRSALRRHRIRTSTTRGVIGNATLANGHTEIKLATAQPGQYLLVWITTLSGGGNNNQSSIGEITYRKAH